MDDLRVENYGEKEVATKKRSISKRVVVTGSAIVLTLGLFSLTGCVEDDENYPMPVGGAGSWYVSIVEKV